MRYTRLLFKVMAVAGIVGMTAFASFAGLNPASPGLPTLTISGYDADPLPNNAMSAACVACHTRQVLGTAQATHFVFDASHATSSGGGWANADTSKTGAIRDGAQYFHVTQWTTAGIFSKYGDPANNRSVSGAAANSVGYESATNVATTAAAQQGMEMICESCHNVVRNVSGGNNLVENPGDIATPRTASDNTQYTDSRVATLCVGCHGWLYDSSTVMTASNAGYVDNVWNMVGETGTTRKNSNAAEYKGGAKRNINHHVMSGDRRELAIAQAWLNWTPTDQFDPAAAHVIDTTVPTSGARAVGYLLKTTWTAPFNRAATATNFSCYGCHTVGHGGAASAGASLLRGGASGEAATPIERIADGTRTWKDQDANIASGAGTWCQNCHKN